MAARCISARVVQAASAAPHALSTRSRATERSCWRTRSTMRITTKPNSTTEAQMITIRSRSPRCSSFSRMQIGAISEAPVSSEQA